MLKKTLVKTVALAAATSFACDPTGMSGFAPKNDHYYSAFGFQQGGISETDFDGIIDRFEEIYAPIVEEKFDNSLNVRRRWTDGTANASADRQGGTFNVTMYGGLARHPDMSADGFAMVLCHEMGHHIGGAPKYEDFFGTSWASNEGQSDYFAAAKCTRRLWLEDDNIAIVSEMIVPEVVKLNCFNGFETENEQALCERASMAGFDLANTLHALGGGNGQDPDFETPDSNVVSGTKHSHPAAQCRLDTYYAASVCGVDFELDVSQSNPRTNTCNRDEGFESGLRPLCWFDPDDG